MTSFVCLGFTLDMENSCQWECCLLTYLRCEHAKSPLTLDFVKVNKRIMDYNNPPPALHTIKSMFNLSFFHTTRFQKKISEFPGLNTHLDYQEQMGVIRICIELAHEQFGFIRLLEQLISSQLSRDNGKTCMEICPLTLFQHIVKHQSSSSL